MSRIEELYAEYTKQDEYVYSSETVRIKKNRAGVNVSLINLKKTIDPKVIDDLDERIMNLATAHEQNGFVMGFRYAMKLAKEAFA